MVSTEVALRAIQGGSSGLLLVAFGGWLLRRQSRQAGALCFGWFGVAWGAQVVARNLAAVTEGETHRGLGLASDAMAFSLTPLLVGFLVLSAPLRPRPRAFAAVAASCGLSLLGAAVFAVDRTAFTVPVGGLKGTAFPSDISSVSLVFGGIPQYAALYASVLLNLRRSAQAASPLAARQQVLLAAGFLAFVAYAVPWYGLRFFSVFGAYLAERGPLETGLHSILFGSGFVVIACAAVAIARMRATPRDRAVLALACAVPLLVGASSGITALVGAAALGTIGLWRAILVGLVVVAITRHRLLDTDPHPSPGLALAFGTFLGGWSVVLVEQIAVRGGSSVTSDARFATIAGAAMIGAVTLPHLVSGRRVARRFLTPLIVPREPDIGQAVVLYRAVIEERLRLGVVVSADDPILVGVRSALQLAASDHAAVLTTIGPSSLRRGRTAESPADHRGTLTSERTVASPLTSGPFAEAPPSVPLGAGRSSYASDASDPASPALDSARASGLATPLPVPEALRIARGVLATLALLHAAGRAHGDVRPATVVVGLDGSVRLAPPAVAALRPPAWRSPEEFRGASPTPASDVHAVGALLHRLIAGRHYVDVDGLPPEGIRALVERAERVPPAAAPPSVAAFLDRALASTPADRFPDAPSALEALDAAVRVVAPV